MTPKKHDLTYIITISALLYVIVLFFSMHYARVLNIASTSGMDKVIAKQGIGRPDPTNWFSITMFAMLEAFSDPLYLKGFTFGKFFPALLGFTGVFLFVLFYAYIRQKVVKQSAPGIEEGSSDWYGSMKQYNKMMVTPYNEKIDRPAGKVDTNLILAEGLKLSMDTHMTRRNLNILVIGGSGTGKTRFFLKPNVCQMDSSYVITDPSGEVLETTGKMLLEHGYTIKILSTSDMTHSNVYNPFDYIYTEEKDPATGELVKKLDETKVKVMVETFMKNVDGKDKKSGGDPFWDKAATSYLTFAIYFLCEFFDERSRNMAAILRLTQLGKTDEASSSSKSALDKMVEARKQKNPNAKCFVSFNTFKLAPAKTANSILITLGVNLEPFGSADKVKNMTTTAYVVKRRDGNGKILEFAKDLKGHYIRSTENLDLDTIGDQKTALFVNIPTANGAYNFLVSMMYSQMFDALYTKAEKICPERFHIYNNVGIALSSEYRTEEEAKRYQKLYADSVVKKYVEKRIIGNRTKEYQKFYLFNKDASPSESLPDMTAFEGPGYIREVYSEEVGKQLIKEYKCSSIKHGKLMVPVPIQCLLDEFANIGEIPEFNEKLATMRKYQISCVIILQSLAQIKAKYDKLWEAMVGNCDTIVFLGSSENDTDKYISEKLGKKTIRVMGTSESHGSSGSNSSNWSMKGRALMDPAEIARMDNNYCIIMIRGFQPFYVKKYPYEKHPNFKFTGDADHKNNLTMEYQDTYFYCADKTMSQAANKQAASRDHAVVEKNQDIDTGKPLTGASGKINDENDFAKAVGAKDIKEAASHIHSVKESDLKSTDGVEVKQIHPSFINAPDTEPPMPDETEPGAPDDEMDLSGKNNTLENSSSDNKNISYDKDTTAGPESGSSNDNPWCFSANVG